MRATIVAGSTPQAAVMQAGNEKRQGSLSKPCRISIQYS